MGRAEVCLISGQFSARRSVSPLFVVLWVSVSPSTVLPYQHRRLSRWPSPLLGTPCRSSPPCRPSRVWPLPCPPSCSRPPVSPPPVVSPAAGPWLDHVCVLPLDPRRALVSSGAHPLACRRSEAAPGPSGWHPCWLRAGRSPLTCRPGPACLALGGSGRGGAPEPTFRRGEAEGRHRGYDSLHLKMDENAQMPETFKFKLKYHH